jgi:hypothetical protein
MQMRRVRSRQLRDRRRVDLGPVGDLIGRPMSGRIA